MPKATKVLVGLGAVAGLFALDFVVLKGTVVLETDLELKTKETVLLALDHSDEQHSIQFSTKSRVLLSWTLYAPDGSVLEETNEYTSRNGKRGFTFTPNRPGNYRLRIETRKRLDLPKLPPPRLKVVAGDNRILGAIYRRF